MKNIFVVICAFVALSLSLFSQSKEDVYNEVVGKFKNLKTLAFNFTMLENPSMSGFIKAKGDGKFYLELKDMTIVSNGKTLWNYIKKDSTVQINNYDADAMEYAPQKFFFLFEKDFSPVKLEKENKSSGESDWVLTCQAKSQKVKNVKFLKLWIDAKSHQIRIAQISTDAGLQSWSIKKLEVNKSVSDKLFEFKIPKGVKKNDLR